MRAAPQLLALAGLLILLAGGAAAQQTQPADAGGEERITVNWRQAELVSVIEEVAKRTKKNFLYESDRVRGQVTLISESALTLDEYWRVFEAILQVKGFTMVGGPGGVLKIIPIRDAKEAPLDTVTGSGRAPNRDVFITRLVPLQYVKAETIVNTFRPLVSKDANVIAYAPTNTMILTDTSANIRRLMTILAEIDIKTYQDQIKVIPIEYADADELAQHLQDIFSEGGRQSTSTRRPTRARAQRAAAAQAASDATQSIFGSAGEPRFITDERTNSLIVIAPSSTIRQVERLISLLDYKRPGTGRIHVYRLQNADAEELAQTLSSLAGRGSGGGGARGRTSGQAGSAAALAQAAVAELEGGVRITADAPTNSLIIQASAEGFAALRDVIQELDLRRPQVMVEALIMEVSADDTTNLGIGWIYRAFAGNSRENVVEIGFNGSRVALGAAATDFQGVFLGNTITVTRPDPADATMTITETFPVVEGLITASQRNNDVNIISAPVILTADNEEAQIVIGENIPIPTSRLQAPTGVAAGGAGTPFATSQNIERQDVGVTLRVTPQISEGDTVRLEIYQELSEVQGEGTASDLGPETTNRTVENTVYVKDGEAVMIGGILADKIDIVESKVPWLGDIPILGWLFKTRSNTLRKTNLLIILTPHIVRDPEDLRSLTVERRERFREGAQGTLGWEDEEEQERARREAEAAGIELPIDPNPVRRELDDHRRVYPTSEFPVLRERAKEREEERQRKMEEVARQAGGSYRVQVSQFQLADEAAELLLRLHDRGYDGTVFSRDEGGRTYHYVQLGPYGTLDKAQQTAREVRADTALNTLVIVEP